MWLMAQENDKIKVMFKHIHQKPFCKQKIHKPNMGIRYIMEIETQEGKNETLQGFIDSIQRYLPDDLSDEAEDMEEYMNEQFEGKIAKITYM